MTSHETALLEVRELHVHFGHRGRARVRAVDGVTFDIRRGETLGLVGESGSGKSTIVRSIVQVETPTAGHIRLEGRPAPTARDRRRLRRSVQMVFQDPRASLDPRQTAAEAIAEPLRIHRYPGGRPARQRRVHELAEQVGLPAPLLGRYPHMLSGGQQQRVSIARALAVEPALLLCDEPVSSLDVSIQAQVVNLFRQLQHELGLAMLFVAHDLAVVRHVSHRVAVLYLGVVVELQDCDALFRRPLHPYTRALIDAAPVPDSRIERGRERILLRGEVPSPADVPPGCRFHTRCPFARDRCRSEVPGLRPAGAGAVVACHFAEEIAAAGGAGPV
jgi:oligopeptide/dipeptide ABC transporter ATP-binding protein